MRLMWKLEQFCSSLWMDSGILFLFFSTKLRPAKTHYSTFDCELLAIYLSIKHFRHFVEGRNFHVVTNHKPLKFAVTSQANHHTPPQIRHLDYISQFTIDIQHIKSEDNQVADTLSRIMMTLLYL